MLNLHKPAKLQAGDKIAAVSLSWGGAATFPDRYALAKKRFEQSHGVTIVETPHALREASWLYENPKARAEDLMQAFADPTIKGIISIIGGEESIRLLPFIDYDMIANNPKIFMGFSDTTVSHFICLKAGLTSFYGPSLLGCYDENVEMFDYTVKSVQRTLFSSELIGEIAPATDEWTGQMLPWQVPENATFKRVRSKPLGPQLLQGEGVARGHLVGGCIEVMDWLRGTEIWPSLDIWDGALLFIETSEERPSPQQFKRMLRNLAALGVLQQVNGILMGRPMCDNDYAQLTQYDKPLLEIVRGECGLSRLPIMTQMDFGHSDPKTVLPMGVQAEIDCHKHALRIVGPHLTAATDNYPN